MTGRERIERILSFKEPDRVPRYDAFWEDTIKNYLAEGLDKKTRKDYVKLEFDSGEKMIGDPVNDCFGFDIDVFYVDNSMRMKPEVIECNDEYTIIADRNGYTARKYNKRSGTIDFMEHVCPDEKAWKLYKKGFVLDVHDESRVDSDSFFLRTTRAPSWDEARIIYDEYIKRQNFLLYAGYGPYEGTWRHHGYTRSLMDIVCEKNLMCEMFDKNTVLTMEIIDHAIKKGMKPHGYWMIEDLGYTYSTLISPETYKEMLMPYHRRIGEYLKSKDIRFFLHSCGKIDTLLPYFIDAGIEVIQPLQANTGINVVSLKKEYNKDITFWGNISAEKLSGDFDEIEGEIGNKVSCAMKGGGYIYHSDHSIPPAVTYQNYTYTIKMLERYGEYR